MQTFPVDLRDYLGGCARIDQQTIDLGEGVQVQNRTAGGEVIRAGGAARLWNGSFTIYGQTYDRGRALHARLHMLRGAGACFYVGDAKVSAASAGTAQIKNVTAAGQLVLQAAPAGLVIEPGDYLSWDYAGRRALHQVVSGRTVKANKETDGIEVVPPIRPGWSAGAAVTLGQAKCLAVMVPGSLRVGTSGPVATSGVSFDWVQTLREYP